MKVFNRYDIKKRLEGLTPGRYEYERENRKLVEVVTDSARPDIWDLKTIIGASDRDGTHYAEIALAHTCNGETVASVMVGPVDNLRELVAGMQTALDQYDAEMLQMELYGGEDL